MASKYDESYLEQLKRERDRIKLVLDCEKSLHTFVRCAWHIIEGNKPFIDGWYIGAICEHLEACIRGEISTLLVNFPPRMTKTTIISIAFPAWTWITKPWAKFLYSSYAQNISWEHSRLCKMMVESWWYRSKWGHIVELSKDQSTKGHFANKAHGHRIATSIGGSTTALGGDVLVCLPYECPIRTDKGLIPIGEIVENKIDCKVLSYNHESNSLEFKGIEEYECNPGKEMIEIVLDDRIIECTIDHPVYVEGKGYIPAHLVNPEDVVLVVPSNDKLCFGML